MELNKVIDILNPYLEKMQLKLYDIKWSKEFGYKILQVFIDKVGGIDTDTLALCNDYLSQELDKIDEDMGEYMLEVSSPGAEKELRNSTEILESVGSYVNVKTDKEEILGELISFDNDILVVKINIKGRMKNVSIKYEDIKKIRLAVKF